MMKRKKLLIWGAGDQGTVTADCALAMNCYQKIDFLEMKEKRQRTIPGFSVYQENEQLRNLLRSYDEVIVATGDNALRKKKIGVLTFMGIPLALIIHPSAVISPSAHISKGTTVLPNAVIHTNANIGMGCIINTGAIIEHDCIVHDYANISPRAAMAGHVSIGEEAFLGIGCVISEAIQVASHCIIGAGAVVIKDTTEHTTLAGVPAQVLK